MHSWQDASASLIEPNTLLVGRYRVVQSLSYGGFGETFQVIDESSECPNGIPKLKVLKVLNLSPFQDERGRHKSIDLFKREANVLSRLRHPGIPKVEPDGYFTWPDDAEMPYHCLIMDYVEGRSLDVWLRLRQNQPLEQDLALEWLLQLLNILDVIHSKGLIHRDIKPSNIMLTDEGQLVLIDFGAVREVTTTYLQSQSDIHTGTRIFAAGYTPHEQIEGRARAESDFFALGRTFVHLMSGIHPMGIDIDDDTGKLAWRDYAPQVSGWLADVLDQMMEVTPVKRPRTAQRILIQLQGTSLQTPRYEPHAFERFTSNENPWPPIMGQVSMHDWSMVKMKQVLQGHSDQVRAIAITPDSTVLASAGFDASIRLWSLPHGKPFKELEGHSKRITAITISGDGKMAASGGHDRYIRLWSLSNDTPLNLLPRQTETIQALVFHPHRQILVSATGTLIQTWNIQSGHSISTLPHHFQSIRSLVISPDGQTIAIGSLSGTVELWNLYSRTRKWRKSYQQDGITSVAFHPSGEMIACATGSTIEFLTMNQKRVGILESRQPGSLTAIAFSTNGQILASASGPRIELWNIPKMVSLSPPLMKHQKSVRSLAFTSNNCMLISAGADHKIMLWQPVRL